MSYHPLAHGFLRRPLSGLGGDVSASVGLPQAMAETAAAAGPYAQAVGGQLLGDARNALLSGNVPPSAVEKVSGAVASAAVQGGCAAATVAATGTGAGAVLAPAVAAGCGWLANKMRGDLGFVIEAPKQPIDPGPFYASLLAESKRGCAPGDKGCEAQVKALVDAFCIGETSPLRVWNLWANNLCNSCSTSWWSGNVSCSTVSDPGCHVKTGWTDSLRLFKSAVANVTSGSRMAAEARFTAAVVASAQATKPSLAPICDGDMGCLDVVDKGVDVLAMDTATELRTRGLGAGSAYWTAALAKLEAEIVDDARDQAELQALQTQGRLAEAARLKAEINARTAASKAKYEARTKERLAAEKSDKRKRVVGAAVLAVALGAAIIMADKKRRRR